MLGVAIGNWDSAAVIYWWTGTETVNNRAYRIAYNGYVSALDKRGWGDYWAYRCVREQGIGKRE